MGFFLPAFIIVFLDQVSKQVFWHLGKRFDLFGDVLRITPVKNIGAAFSLFQGKRLFFIIASILASAFIIYVGLKTPREEKCKRLAFSLILGGALGNLIDRIYPGEVIDFIDMGIGIHRWPVYNLADIAITIGSLFLFLSFLRTGKKEDGG